MRPSTTAEVAAIVKLCAAALLPIVLVFILKLAADRSLMGEQANSRVSQVIGVGTAVGASALSIALVAVTLLGAG